MEEAPRLQVVGTVALAVALLLMTGSGLSANDKRKESLLVQAVSYRVIPLQKTRYFRTQGYSNTNCYGSGSDWGYSTAVTLHCQMTTTPPQDIPVTVSSVEVYNQLEANGMIYTITCTAHWIGSKCSWLIPGDRFQAEVNGRTMWITGRKGGNMGKELRAKYKILDIRPKP
jgi:hypothetical protein